MSLLNEIANAIGHTPETLAEATGTSVGMLERVLGGLGEEGIDVFSAASRLGLTPNGLLRGIVQTMKSGDPHQQLLDALLAPVKPMSDPLASLTSQWLHLMDLHQSTAHAIDRHIQDLFAASGTESYSGPAADTLWETHQEFQRYFGILIEHAQTQHTCHRTLSGQVDDYVTQMSGQVNSLSAPVAAFGVLSLQLAADVDPLSLINPYPAPLINPQPLVKEKEDLEQRARRARDLGSRTILDTLARILGVLIFLAVLINTLDRAINYHNNQQRQTTVPKPTAPKPTPGPINLLPDQEKLAKDLSNKYHVPLSVVEDIIRQNPGLTSEEYELLVQYYKKYGTYPYGVVTVLLD